jgi:threonine/homoserine/homoserine lactone efflux protein
VNREPVDSVLGKRAAATTVVGFRAMLIQLTWLLGVLTLGLLSPGPDFFLVVKNSLGGSRRRAFGTAIGIAAGLVIQMGLISLGFAVLPRGVLTGVQIAGAMFLAYVGSRALFARADDSASEALRQAPSAPGGRRGFVEGFLCNVTNPKVFLFFVSVFAQVVKPGSSPSWRVLLPVVVSLHGLVCWSLIVMALQSPPVAARLARAQRWLPRVFGAALLLFAGWMAWEVVVAWRG